MAFTQLAKSDFLMASATFLVLEDTPAFRAQLLADMKNLGIKGTILEADCVKAAKTFLATKQIDFIISDWNLPDGNGLDFLVETRKDPKYKTTPFLMWTTMNEVGNIIQAITAGAHEYFYKPWTIDVLEKKIGVAWQKVHGKKF